MPLVYYLFDYVTTKFSTLLYSGSKVVVEFLAFSMCLSYVIFLLVYFQEYELKNRAEQYGQLTAMQLSSLRSEIEQAASVNAVCGSCAMTRAITSLPSKA